MKKRMNARERRTIAKEVVKEKIKNKQKDRELDLKVVRTMFEDMEAITSNVGLDDYTLYLHYSGKISLSMKLLARIKRRFGGQERAIQFITEYIDYDTELNGDIGFILGEFDSKIHHSMSARHILNTSTFKNEQDYDKIPIDPPSIVFSEETNKLVTKTGDGVLRELRNMFNDGDEISKLETDDVKCKIPLYKIPTGYEIVEQED